MLATEGAGALCSGRGRTRLARVRVLLYGAGDSRGRSWLLAAHQDGRRLFEVGVNFAHHGVAGGAQFAHYAAHGDHHVGELFGSQNDQRNNRDDDNFRNAHCGSDRRCEKRLFTYLNYSRNRATCARP